MKYYVIINGNSSLDIQGLAIESLPNISKPLIRTTREEIDGRDGDIITKLGYSAYDKTLNIGLWGNYDINEVIAFFNEEGVITFSNEPDKYYKFHILNRIDFVNQLEKFKKASITIHCQPFKYKEQEAKVIEEEEHTTSGTSFNLSDTLEAPLLMDLKGNTSQTGTPTPDTPIPVNVVSGDNDIVVCGKNLLDLDSLTFRNGYYDNQGRFIGANNNGTIEFINVLPNTTYTFSLNTNISGGSLVEFNNNSFIQRNSIANNTSTKTITTTSTTNKIAIFMNKDGSTTMTKDLIASMQPMLELGTQATTYEPYNGATYNIDLPVENLLKTPYETTSITASGITYNANEDGSITLTGTATNRVTFALLRDTNKEIIKDNVAYSIKGGTAGANLYFNGAPGLDTGNGYTFTYTSSMTNTRLIGILINEGTTLNTTIYPMFVKGNVIPNTYTPYGTTPIELNKIGTYQDYIYKENDKWYLHKEIGKVVLDGSESVSVRNSGTSNWLYAISTKSYIPTSSQTSQLCNYYNNSEIFNGNTNQGIMLITNGNEIRVRYGIEDTAQNYKNWLSSHNVSLYYIMTTPTNTEITYTPLIEQLNTLEQAQSYEGTTNINQVNNDLPFIIDLTYYTGDTSITITNDGNIYSKPLLELKGTGNINIYLNGIQVFVVSLNNEIIYIDTDKMEAYYQGTLKNRQVVGDYNNFKLQSGNNTIQVDGGYVEYLKITNYSRWV